MYSFVANLRQQPEMDPFIEDNFVLFSAQDDLVHIFSLFRVHYPPFIAKKVSPLFPSELPMPSIFHYFYTGIAASICEQSKFQQNSSTLYTAKASLDLHPSEFTQEICRQAGEETNFLQDESYCLNLLISAYESLAASSSSFCQSLEASGSNVLLYCGHNNPCLATNWDLQTTMTWLTGWSPHMQNMDDYWHILEVENLNRKLDLPFGLNLVGRGLRIVCYNWLFPPAVPFVPVAVVPPVNPEPEPCRHHVHILNSAIRSQLQIPLHTHNLFDSILELQVPYRLFVNFPNYIFLPLSFQYLKFHCLNYTLL